MLDPIGVKHVLAEVTDIHVPERKVACWAIPAAAAKMTRREVTSRRIEVSLATGVPPSKLPETGGTLWGLQSGP